MGSWPGRTTVCCRDRRKVVGGGGMSVVADLEMGLKCEQPQQMLSEATGIPGYDRDQPLAWVRHITATGEVLY